MQKKNSANGNGAPGNSFDQKLADKKRPTEVMQRAVREALLQHKRLGNSIAVWRDGKVVILSPEEITVD